MNELNKIRKIFAGRTHKLSGKVKLEIEKGQEKHRTIIAPYEPTVEKLQALITEQVRLGREKWLDGQIKHLLDDIYPEDLFTPPTDEDYRKANDFDANLHTRLHCDGIRHGLQVLRREVRGLSARDDLPPISDTTLLEGGK